MIYEIKSEKLTVKVNSLGAELINCTGGDGHEYIHQPSKEWVGQAKNLFPSIGQTKDNFILVDGERYKAQFAGFAKDTEFDLFEQGGNYVKFVMRSSNKTKEFLPYDFNFYICFELNGDTLTQTFKVENLWNKQMYFAIGTHPGFSAPKGSYLDFGTNCSLTEIKRKDMMYLTGKSDRYVLENGKLPLLPNSYNHGADILTGFNCKKVTLKNETDTHTVTIDFSQFAYLGMWGPANSQVAISIMPWCGLPDADNTSHNFEEKQGNIRLPKGESFTVKLFMSFR